MSGKRERDRVLGHAAEADGIEEYDNPLPNWWLGLFYFTIVWAVAYTVHYHLIADRSLPKAYAAEVAEAQRRWPAPAAGAGPGELAITEAAVKAGEAIYKANCVPCHGADLKGGIGPNLLDSTWIHGGKPADILRTITNGVPEKGMLTWGPILGPEKVAQVAAYVVHANHEALGIKDEAPGGS
ncbi:MAG TPA: cbb3-type cytochrome c oxidase N-terminal domain-containing protein [Gemmatimonadales bacterium]|nr:cbb3-type cytochrome c oxidase N-terminal domain-containing protein [Gemmatimonadales bacterium]